MKKLLCLFLIVGCASVTNRSRIPTIDVVKSCNTPIVYGAAKSDTIFITRIDRWRDHCELDYSQSYCDQWMCQEVQKIESRYSHRIETQ